MKWLPCFLLSFCCFYSFAQPAIQWQKSFGGSGHEVAYSIQQTPDSGYVVAGWSISNDGDVTGNHGDYDYWIVKLNGNGMISWEKSFGGSGIDHAFAIQRTNNNGYIVAGSSNSNDSEVSGNHGSYDSWIVKLDSTGVIQWQKSLGGTGNEVAWSIQQTTDSGYIVAGGSNSNDGDITANHGGYDYWIVRLDSMGTVQWQKSLGGSADDIAYSIQQTNDGGYIVAGESYSNDGDVTGNHGVIDYWIVKLNSMGGIQWQKCLGGTSADFAYSIQQTSDSGYIIAGDSFSNDSDVTANHGGHDYWIVKLNNIGVIQWQKCLGGTGYYDAAFSIQQTTDGGSVVAGYSNSVDGDVTGNHGGNSDYWIVKQDSTGAVQWQKCLGGTSQDNAYSIRETIDGGYIVAGGSSSNNGDITAGRGGFDYWIVKLSPVVLGATEINTSLSNPQIFPNPISNLTTISFSLLQSEKISVNIYDITGRLIKNLIIGNLNPGEHQLKWNVADENKIDDGVYLLNITGESFSQSCKLVVVKQ